MFVRIPMFLESFHNLIRFLQLFRIFWSNYLQFVSNLFCKLETDCFLSILTKRNCSNLQYSNSITKTVGRSSCYDFQTVLHDCRILSILIPCLKDGNSTLSENAYSPWTLLKQIRLKSICSSFRNMFKERVAAFKVVRENRFSWART